MEVSTGVKDPQFDPTPDVVSVVLGEVQRPFTTDISEVVQDVIYQECRLPAPTPLPGVFTPLQTLLNRPKVESGTNRSFVPDRSRRQRQRAQEVPQRVGSGDDTLQSYRSGQPTRGPSKHSTRRKRETRPTSRAGVTVTPGADLALLPTRHSSQKCITLQG